MKKKILFSLIPLFLFWFSPFLSAQPALPFDRSLVEPKKVSSLAAFKEIAVLENGRIKPLDTYARNVLLRFSGRRSFGKREAIDWFAELVFAPEFARDDKIFLINNPAIVEALGIEEERKRRYSFDQLGPQFPRLEQLALAANEIDEKERDIVEIELMRIYQNLRHYSTLSWTFSFAFPHPDFTITDPQTLSKLDLPENINQFSFLDIALRADQLQEISKPLETLDPGQWSDAQKELIKMLENLFQWSFVYRNLPVTIVPAYNFENEAWYSPWDASVIALSVPHGRKELAALVDLTTAYWNGQQLDFDLAARTFRSSISERTKEQWGSRMKFLSLELLYNRLQLFFISKLFYFIAFIVVLMSLTTSRFFLQRISFILIISGFLPHTTAILLRILILQRPPVSNLYETFIFVGFVSVLTGLFIEYVIKKGIGNVIASISGFVFLTIAGKFSGEGDTLQMLVAVLDSNFWLSTHVISITIGYSGVCVAGLVGHIYILQAIFQPKNKVLLNSTHRLLLGTLGFGLALTFLGTNLGGIWADQSWGRFWGWDPKENGALLIVLWTAILFHAKVARIIGPLGLAAGSVLGIIVVMWAWFGVNLLSVGLHSYGFTSGLARNLAIYGVLQALFLTIAVPMACRKLIKSKL